MLLISMTVIFRGLPGSWFPGLFGAERLTPEPTPSATAVPASIAGIVWHDRCVGNTGLSEGEAPIGCVVTTGGAAYAADGRLDAGEAGIEGVTVSLGLGACPSSGLAAVRTNQQGVYVFPQVQPGTYCVSIDALGDGNGLTLLDGKWTHPAQQGERAEVTVVLDEGEFLRDVNFGWDFAHLPVPTPTPTPTPGVSVPTPEDPDCVNQATFMLDVTIPDNNNLKPGAAFDKVWRLRNTGSCTWTTEYDLVYLSGERMRAPDSVPLPGDVGPGREVDVKVRLLAPSAQGTYRGNWMLRDENGVLFGVGGKAQEPVWVQIVVRPTAFIGPLTWRGEYYSNRALKGSPEMIRQDPVIDFNWKRGAPSGRMSDDNFSIRWTGDVKLDAGVYRFSAYADDGLRLWVDDDLVIDAWVDGARELSADVGLAAGTHRLRVEYFEHTGVARISLEIERVKSPTFSHWKGEYWAIDRFRGDPALVRNDREIDFRWRRNAPAVGLPADHFNVRWTRSINFQEGRYRFNAIADDGIRVTLDGVLVLDEWHASDGSETYNTELTLSGKHTLVVEYFERTGAARVHFWYERLAGLATPTSTPSVTPTPTASATPTATPTGIVPGTPTSTPSPTATWEPSATPTPTPTATQDPGPQVAYDFAASYCAASWRSGAGELLCPGTPGDTAGYVLSVEDPALEGGVVGQAAALVTVPDAGEAGWIQGTFPFITIQPGDRFKATLGCLDAGAGCHVVFKLGYLTDANPDPNTGVHNLGTWTEISDGQMTEVDVGLTPLTASNIAFVFSVVSQEGGTLNTAFWLAPSIWR
jgi:hypothetical protein